MNEQEFNQQAAAVFSHIEQTLDDSDADIDCNLNEGVMELEFADGSKIIINRHAPNKEIWVAARSGGFHYARKENSWINTRDGSELFASLETLISQQSGEDIDLGANPGL